MNKTPRGIRVIAPPDFARLFRLPGDYWEKTRPLAIRKPPIAAGKLCDWKRWTTKDTRRFLVDLACDDELKAAVGIDSLKTALQMATEQLDERELWILVTSLARKRKKNDALDSLDHVICYLWDRPIDVETPKGAYEFLGGLCHWSASAASALLTLYLHQRGVRYRLSSGAYNKRVKRLRRRGVALNYAERLLVEAGEWDGNRAGATVTIVRGKARENIIQVTAWSS